MVNKIIHPFYNPLLLRRVTSALEPIPAVYGQQAGSLNWLPANQSINQLFCTQSINLSFHPHTTRFVTNSHNTARVDLPEVVQFAENLPLFDIAAHVSPE